MKKIEANQLPGNVIDMIGQDWLLIGAGNQDSNNAMTASWGTIGYMFNKPIATIVVRPTRYTAEFIDNSTHFTITVLEDGYRDALMTMGRVSGRECNKVEKAGLTQSFTPMGNPTFEQAKIVLECRKIFKQPMNDSSFIDRELVDKWYDQAHGAFHDIYMGEIVNCWIRE